MRAIFLSIGVAFMASVGCQPPATRVTAPANSATLPVTFNTFAFLESYRIEHYLDSAVEIQKLTVDQRAARLKELAADPKRASEVYPLCRMLFQAKPGGEFRGPMIGGAFFIGGTYRDWPLEPIAVFDHVPILVVTGYVLAGWPEPPGWYVDYCLKNCQWRDARYEAVPPEKRKEAVEQFITANPDARADADRLRLQAQ